MAKRKSGLSKFRKNASDAAAVMPAEVSRHFVQSVLPVAGGYVTVRVLNQLGRAIIAKKLPRLGRHAGPIASIVSLAAIWYGAKKWRAISTYHSEILAGAMLAAIQSIVTTYFPGFAWIFNQTALPPVQQQAVASGDYDELDEGVDDEVPVNDRTVNAAEQAQRADFSRGSTFDSIEPEPGEDLGIFAQKN